jgi:hypothetical protein
MDFPHVISDFGFVAEVKFWPVPVAKAYDFCFKFWIAIFAATRRQYNLSYIEFFFFHRIYNAERSKNS